MLWNHDLRVYTIIAKVGGNKNEAVVAFAKESVDFRCVVMFVIGISEVERITMRNSLNQVANIEQKGIEFAKSALLVVEFRKVAFAIIVPLLKRRHAPIVEDCGFTAITAKTFGIGGFFAEFLPGINHEWAGRDCSADNSRRNRQLWVVKELARSEP